MADAKKPDAKKDKGGDKKPEKKPAGYDFGFDDLGSIALVIAVLYLVYEGVSGYFNIGVGNQSSSATSTSSSFSSSWLTFREWFAHFFAETLTSMTFISIFLALMFIMGAFYAKFRREEVIALAKYKSAQRLGRGKRAGMKYHGVNVGGVGLPGTDQAGTDGPGHRANGTSSGPISNIADGGLATVETAGAVQWKQIEKHMQSNNQSDWRYAIMEADILLYDMLEQIGMPGETIGDKLKSANSASFTTLDYAWGAHKVRNLIAHQGMTYELSYVEARRTIDMFKKVFDEFYFI